MAHIDSNMTIDGELNPVDKTSDIINDGATGQSKYVEQDELNEVIDDLESDISDTIEDVRNQIQNLSGDKNFIYEQVFPNKVWEFIHPLNKMPAPTVVDTAGTVMLAQVTINDGVRIRIEFNYPINGKVILN